MTQHTPGPWIVWPDNNNRLQVGQSTNYTVAEIMQTPIHGQEANARLIAAAPDLLEALQAIANGTEFWDSYPLEHSYGKARAAIVKAIGDKQ